MKSSIMTMSWCRSSFGLGATSPVLITFEVLDARACTLRARPTAILLINICEHRAETFNCCGDSAIGTRYVEGHFGNVAPHRCEQTGETEGLEDLTVGGIAKQHGQSALRSARRRSL